MQTCEGISRLADVHGTQGIALLAYWTGSLLADELREKQGTFPFLDLYGEQKSGKTTIIKYLNRVIQNDHERIEFSPSEIKCLRKALLQPENLPIVLDGSFKFNFDKLKPLYNSRHIYSCADYFKGSIVFTSHSSMKSITSSLFTIRTVRLKFTPRDLFSILTIFSSAELSPFMAFFEENRQEIFNSILADTPIWVQRFKDDRSLNVHPRLYKNYAQLASLMSVLPFSYGRQAHLLDRENIANYLTGMMKDHSITIPCDPNIIN